MFKPKKDDTLGVFQHGVAVGTDLERDRILSIIMNDDWSGESLVEDKANLRYRITQNALDN